MKKYFPNIVLKDFNYSLPKERIALYPLTDRSSSKLLIAKKISKSEDNITTSGLDTFGDQPDIRIEHRTFKDLPKVLPERSIIFVNDTRVISARLMFKKITGGLVEIFCLEPIYPSTDPVVSLNSTQKTTWKCLFSGRNIKEGTILTSQLNESNKSLNALILNKNGRELIVEFFWEEINKPFIKMIDKIGIVPLPPYIKRQSEEMDAVSYQTVYANTEGSVAAPTAGLHFTEEVFDELRKKKIDINFLTLHIGLGTFSPIETNEVSNHNMHSEIFSIKVETLKLLYKFLKDKDPGKMVAVGTTSLRTLETLYWIGVKIMFGSKFRNDLSETILNQFEPYFLQKTKDLPSAEESMKNLIKHLEYDLQVKTLYGRTELFIVPGYDFKIADTLITNFHLPGSTLILLVAAYVGEKNYHLIYKEALENDYRFLSYGDSSILFR